MDIYAEITKRDLKRIEDGRFNILSGLPSGSSVKRKRGSRACFIECDSDDASDVAEFLDDNGISWQEN